MHALAVCLLLLQQDPRDRLADAIRETRLEDVKPALRVVVALDGAKAARALIASLPRARDRIGTLHGAVSRARADFDRIDTGLTITKEEETLKAKSLAAARERLKESHRMAVEGELVYDALRAAFASLKPEAVPVVAGQAETTGSWLLKCELLEALGTMNAQEALLAAIARETEPVVLATALHGVSSEKTAGFLEHRNWQVRLAALRAVPKSRDSVDAMVGALATGDGRFRLEAAEKLVAITDTRLPADPDVWRDWWKANRDDFLAGTYSPKEMRRDGPGRTTFYDVPIASTRVCFVIDRSRSMAEQGRFDTARKELKRLLEELPDGARVNIVFFGETTSSFSLSTRALDRSARLDAARYIDTQGYEEGTNILLALEKALTYVGSCDSGRLREEGVDTIVLLSDGESTVGKLVDDQLIARVVARRARYLGPVIHTVSIASDGAAMQLLAELTGGEYRAK